MFGARWNRFVVALAALICGANALHAQCLDWRAFPSSHAGFNSYQGKSQRFDAFGVKSLYFVTWSPSMALVRWDGTTLQAVPGGLGGTILDLTVFDDGTGQALYAGGVSLSINGSPAGVLARFDGLTWTPVPGLSLPTVSHLTVHDDGTGPALIVAGETSPGTGGGGTSLSRVLSWNGTTWTDLAFPSTPQFFFPATFALLSTDLGSGPELYLSWRSGGSSATGGRLYKRSAGAWSLIPGTNQFVTHAAAMDDGNGPSVFVADYSVSGGFPAVRRWDGSAWHTVAAWNGHDIRYLDAVDDGTGMRLYVGHPLGYPSSLIPAIQVWDGISWTQTLPPVGGCLYGGSPEPVGTTAIDFGSGTILVAIASAPGLFGFPSGLSIRVGGQWQDINPAHTGLSGTVRALAVADTGNGPRLYVAGSNCYAGSLNARGLSVWDGTAWSLPAGSTTTQYGYQALTPWTSLSGTGLAYARSVLVGIWDGNVFSDLVSLSGPSGIGYAVQQFGNELWFGGAFLYANGTPTPNIGRWNGTSVVAMGTGANGAVNALTTFNDGSGPALYAAGSFTLMNGASAGRVARWNGTSWSALGSGLSDLCDALVVFDDGSGPALYAAGTFTLAGGASASRVARWKNNAWSALGAGLNAQVLSLGVFDDGSGPALYAGGNFTASGSVPINRVAKWDGSQWKALGLGVDGAVWAFQTFDDGTGIAPQLFVGGDFSHAANNSSKALAAWRGCGGTIARYCFGDGTVTDCPCANQGLPSRGCNNSFLTGGVRMNASGTTSPDAIEFYLAGLIPGTATMLFQGSTALSAPISFGDGLLCAGGNLLRLELAFAGDGTLGFPSAGGSSISALSAALGDPLVPGSVRGYQAWYRDANLSFCSAATSNLSNAVRIAW